MAFRTDLHNNPTGMTTDLAAQGGLQLGVDYSVGDGFSSFGKLLHTARLHGDPVELTILVIDKVGFFTQNGSARWTYIAVPDFVWLALPRQIKWRIIGWMYQREGGTALKWLFPE